MKKIGFSKLLNETVRREIFQHLNAETEINEDGSVYWKHGFQIEELISVLRDGFELPSEIANRDSSYIIRRSIFDARKKGLITDSSVLQELNRKVAQWLQNDLSNYAVCLRVSENPYHLEKGRRINFDGVKIELCRNIPSYMLIDSRDVCAISNMVQPDPGLGAYLIARCKARSENDAADQIFDAVALFQSVYNVIVKTWNLFGTQQRPEASMQVGPYYLFFKNGKSILNGSVWYNENYRREFWKLPNVNSRNFNEKVAVLRRALAALEHHPLRAAISSSFLMMNDGMEAFDMSRRTLRYWTALERLFQVEDERVSYERIIRRATYLDGPEDFSSVKLNRIVRIRNRYVHFGQIETEHHQLTQFLAQHIKSHLFYILFNGDDFLDHAEFVEMTDLPSAGDALARRSRAILRRQLMIQKRRHRID